MSADTEKKVALTNEKVIGNGSFGVVFQATLVETGENVAVKKVLQDKRFKVGLGTQRFRGRSAHQAARLRKDLSLCSLAFTAAGWPGTVGG